VVAYKRFTGFVMSLLYCNSIFKGPDSSGLFVCLRKRFR